MKYILTIFLLVLPFLAQANELERWTLKELPKVAALYADGYARLVQDSLKVKLLYKDKEGECTLVASFKMEGFSAVPNYTQFVAFYNCPTFHKLERPNKKVFMSDLFRFFVGEPYLDITTATIDGNLIKINGVSKKNRRPVVAIFDPSGGPGWWRLKQVQGMADHEILSGM